jgi:hypothetical protein
MSISEMISFLSSLKYGDRALTDIRIEHDRRLDAICLYLHEQVARPPRGEVDSDCAGGACPVR